VRLQLRDPGRHARRHPAEPVEGPLGELPRALDVHVRARCADIHGCSRPPARRAEGR
jgi:hypothetical protein